MRLVLSVFVTAVLANPVLGQSLELKRINLSSSGVGYFEYEAVVTNEATLKLQVKLSEVNDVLKSLVVYDSAGGIGGLSLPGSDPLGESLRQLSFDASALQSNATLLEALRGAEVMVSGLQGRIVSVQKFQFVGKEGSTEKHRLSLMTATGLQQLVLEDAGALQFTDPALREQVVRALSAMANNRAQDSRTLELVSKGRGTRTVRVAYVTSVPVWKTAYRLTVPDAAALNAQTKAQMQAWAVVENLSGQDWKNVELTLTSGKSVAFRQDLYRSYFAQRPEVGVDLPNAIVPRADSGTFAPAVSAAPVAPRAFAAPAPAPAPAYSTARAAPALRSVPSAASSYAPGGADRLAEFADAPFAQEAATQVSYRFALPVSVGAGRSLSVPIVQADVPINRVAQYQPQVSSQYPLAAVELSNSTGLVLPSGAVTVYESGDRAGGFIGDAQLTALAPGDSRYLGYALDQKMAIASQVAQTQNIRRLRIERNWLQVELLERRSTTFTIKSNGSVHAELVVEVPQMQGWNLLTPPGKLLGTAMNQHRISLPVSASATLAHTIVQERSTTNPQDLSGMDALSMSNYLARTEMDEATRERLTRLRGLRQAIDNAHAAWEKANDALALLKSDQERLRNNLKASVGSPSLQKRYAQALEKSEQEIEQGIKERDSAQNKKQLAQTALTDYLK